MTESPMAVTPPEGTGDGGVGRGVGFVEAIGPARELGRGLGLGVGRGLGRGTGVRLKTGDGDGGSTMGVASGMYVDSDGVGVGGDGDGSTTMGVGAVAHPAAATRMTRIAFTRMPPACRGT
jgi:hypothetical protein